MGFKYKKLLGRIVEVFGTRQSFATAMGLSENSLRAKLTGESAFRQDEIAKACVLLGIDIQDVYIYFFTV